MRVLTRNKQLKTKLMAMMGVASLVVSLITQSQVLALAAPNIDHQQRVLSDDQYAGVDVSDSVVMGNGDIYEIGTFEGEVDFNPAAGVDKKSSYDAESGFLRVSDANGVYKRTLVLHGEVVTEEWEGETYEWYEGGVGDDEYPAIGLSPDKSMYYVAGNFYGTVDFDTGAGEVMKTTGDGGGMFIAAYSTANDSLLKVSVVSNVEFKDMAVSPVTGDIAIASSLRDESGSVDLNPDAGTDSVAASAMLAGLVSIYDDELNYDDTYVYDNGDSDLVFEMGPVNYDSFGRLSFAVNLKTRNGNPGANGTVDLNPIDGVSDDYAYDFPQSSMHIQAVIGIESNGTYEDAWVFEPQGTAHMHLFDVLTDNVGNRFMTGFLYGQYDVNPVRGGGAIDSRTYTMTVGFIAKLNSAGQFVSFYTAPASTSVEMIYYRGAVDSNNNLYLIGKLNHYDSETGAVEYDVDPTEGTDTRELTYGSRGIVTRFAADGNYDYTIISQPGATDSGSMSIALDSQDRPHATISTTTIRNTQDDEDCSLNPEEYAGMASARFSNSGATSSSNWLNFGETSGVYIEGCDADLDGISDADEGNIAGGDANGDETPDRTQEYVSALTNPVTNDVTALEVDDDCQLSDVSVKTEAQTGADEGYYYPLGLLDFTATCSGDGTVTVKQIYYNPPAGDFVLRKYANGAYQMIEDATITRTTIGGANVIVAEYVVVDGGPLDADGEVNGVIVDPAGLALAGTNPAVTVPGVPNTGVGAIISLASVSILPALSISAVIGILLVATRTIIRSRR